MLKEERQRKILNYLMDKKTVRTNDLSHQLGVSEVTIRKDLKELERKIGITKIYGGAVLKNDSDFPYSLRDTENIAEKKLIARKAVELINQNDIIFLDAGTTTYQIGNMIGENKLKISVVTNSLMVANNLIQSDIDVKIIGGDLRKETFSTIGRDAEEHLDKIHFNKLFLAASGISLEFGITNTNIFEAELKKKMIERAKKVILVADSSKIDILALNKVANLDAVDTLITDEKIDKSFLEQIKNYVEVIIARENQEEI